VKRLLDDINKSLFNEEIRVFNSLELFLFKETRLLELFLEIVDRLLEVS
jgi:hypothetical protein